VAEPLLVVDDSALNRDMLSRRLRARGYRVDLAADGPEALAMVAERGYALVLLDVMMPGMSGLDVLARVRETAGPADLPIIMATARVDSDDIVEALNRGANDYVTKPLDFPVVLARVEGQLALRAAKEKVERLVKELEVRNRFIQSTFGRYLSAEVVAGLLERADGLDLGGERRRVTILMSDLRGFTSLSERLLPEHVTAMLNNYLGAMADVIARYGGTITDFVGDSILAVFGAPTRHDDDAARAVACAVAMQEAMASVNAHNRASGFPELEMGIGLNTGDVVVGNIGSETRARYGVVGGPVNVAARIEAKTVGGQVLVSESTLATAGEIIAAGDRQIMHAKGVSAPMLLHDVLAVGPPFDLTVPRRDERLVDLPSGIETVYRFIRDKQIAEDPAVAHIVRLSAGMAEVRAAHAIPIPSDLHIRVLDASGATMPGDLYAKAIRSVEGDGARFLLRFTSTPPEIAAFLKEQLTAATAPG
jgi:class 3 adenylate cyclase/CheY-like chemotaxis protein